MYVKHFEILVIKRQRNFLINSDQTRIMIQTM